MRIALIAPIAHPVLPGVGASIEELVWLLCEELVRRGHRVTLFATADSSTSARLDSAYPHGYEHDSELWNWRLHESVNVAEAFERAREFDIIHSHAGHFAVPFSRLVDTPVAHTVYANADPDVLEAYRLYPESHLIALWDWQRSALPGPGRASTIHPGIDTQSCPLSSPPGRYVLLLDDVDVDEGLSGEVRRLAEASPLPLLSAGLDPDGVRAVRLVGEGEQTLDPAGIDVTDRGALLAGAGAVIATSAVIGPFCPALSQAMAYGTPVLARSSEVAAELVRPGVSGWHAPTLTQLAERIPAALRLDRARVRAWAVQQFEIVHVADRHEALYRKLAGQR